MAVVFFEGFNRGLDPNHWLGTANSQNGQAPGPECCGRTENRYRMPGASSNYSATQSALKATFSTLSSTKVYIGFALDYMATQRSYDGGSAGAKQKYFAVYAGAGAELFHIAARAAASGMALSIYDPTAPSSPVGSFIINTNTNIPGTSMYFEGWGHAMNGWNYLEFEIDLVSNTIAARRNGQTLFTENTGALTVLLTMALPSIGAFTFYGHPGQDYAIDDMYIADATGTTANTWLGLNTRVYSPGFNAGTPAEWSNGSNAVAINSDDNDNNFISTNVINKVNVFDTAVSPSPSDAVVGGIKLLSVARKVTLDAAYRHVYKHTNDIVYNLSSNFNLTSTTYQRSSSFTFQNPATASPWTLADLDSGKFGVKSVEYVPSSGGTPVITIDGQPANQTPAANNTNTYSVTFSVSAAVTENATMSYQWQKAEAEDPTVFADISGANTAVLTRTGLSYPTGDGDKYRVIVSATGGATSVTSNAATLTVPPLTVPNVPTSVSGTSGNTQITVSWAAPAYTGGSAITDYKVAMSEDNGASWDSGTYVGSNTTSLAVTGLINGDLYKFKVLAVNAQGEGDYSVESASLVPVGEVLAITGQPVNAYAVTTESVDFTVAATGTGLTYQWEAYSFSYDTYDFVWLTLTGETTATLTLSSTKLGTLNIYYPSGPLSVAPVRCNVTDVANVTQTTKTARLVLMNSYGFSPNIYSYYGGINYNSFETVDGVRYDQYTPDQNAAANPLQAEIYDMSMGGGDYSWFTGDEFSVEFQISADRITWTTISTPATGHSVYASYEVPITTGTKYYRWLVKYLWPRPITNTTVNSPENSVQTDYVFPITNFKINWPSVPAAPTNVVGYPDNNQIVLFWTPPTNNGNSAITGYNIQTSTNGSTWSPWGSNPVNATSANITGLVNGTPYYFRVAAINVVGAGDYSAASAAVQPALLTPTADLAFGNVSLLMPFDALTAGPAPTMVDNSQYEHTALPNNGAALTATPSRFNASALSLDGNNSQYIEVSAHPAFDMGTGDFTIEFWLYCANSSANSPSYLAAYSSTWTTGAFCIRYDDLGSNAANKFLFYWHSPGGVINAMTSNTYSYNRLRHFALVRDGSTMRMYIDGVQDGTVGINSGWAWDLAFGGSLTIGRSLWDGPAGYVTDAIDELRITKGLCRYPSGTTFTPSTVPFADFGPPAQPTNLQLTTGNGSVSLIWTAPAFAGGLALTDYVVQYGVVPASTDPADWTTFSDGTSTATSATVTGLTNGTTYYFRVAAVNTATQGNFTAASSGVIPTAAPNLTKAAVAPFSTATGDGTAGVPLVWSGSWTAGGLSTMFTAVAAGTLNLSLTLSGGCGDYGCDVFQVTRNGSVVFTPALGTNVTRSTTFSVSAGDVIRLNVVPDGPAYSVTAFSAHI